MTPHPPPGRPAPIAASLLLAMTAGASALSLEVLWARLLAIQVGGPLTAFTIVVTAFMIGLSAGAWVLGRAADRARRPLAWFGVLQIGIAVAGATSALAGPLMRHTLRVLGSRPGTPAFVIAETCLGLVLVAAPAFLMGGTLPLLLRAAATTRVPSRLCGAIAASNALGAASGSLITGFVLIPALGLKGSLLIASTTALACGAAALVLSSLGGRASATPTPGPPDAPIAPRGSPLVLLAAAGAALTSLEIVWARMSDLSFGASARAASLVLAIVIAALAAGNLLGGRMADRPGDPSRRLTAILLAAAAAALLGEPLLGRLPLVAARLSARILPGDGIAVAAPHGHLAQAVLLGALVGPVCLLIGAAFPVGFRAIASSRPESGSGRAAGLASAATSVGNLAGAPIAYILLMTPLGSRRILFATVLCVILVCLACAAPGAARRIAALLLVATIVSGALPGWDPAVISSGPFLYGSMYRAATGSEDLESILRSRGRVVYLSDGPHALVTVRQRDDGILSLQVNGKTDASTGGDMKTQALVGHLPLLAYEASRPGPPRTALVIGMGSGVSAGAALTHPIASLDVVEIAGGVVRAAALFEEANRGALSDPRVSVVLEDARSWLLFEPRRYDVIASQPSNPWVAGQAALFTREFFEAARARLTEGGILCQWLQGHGLAARDFRSVIATFTHVFPHASLWEESTAGGDYLLIGSDDPVTIRPATLREAMGRPTVAESLNRVEIDDPADLLELHVADGDRLVAFTAGAPIQTEDRLGLESSAPVALGTETLGEILAALEPWRTDNARRWSHDRDLAHALARRARAAREERAWAAGLGLLAARPHDPLLQDAISWLRGGMPERALVQVRRAASARPGDALPHLLQAQIAMTIGAHDEAVRALTSALAVTHGDDRVRLFLARALFASGRILEALAHNAESLRTEDPLAEASSDRCAMLIHLDDLPSAEAACRDALAQDPALAEAHANLGLIHVRRARRAEAEASYLEALAIDPYLDDARFNLAALYERTGREHEGLSVMDPLVERAPFDGDVLRLAARLALATGDRERARAWIDRSLTLDPSNEESLDLSRRIAQAPG